MQLHELCIKEIENEIELIDELLLSHDSLIEKTKNSTLNRIEISAAATVLHSFYNGIENIFLRIANRLDNKIPSSEFWHKELLEQMKEKYREREPVISEELYEKLKLYLGFRHFFRHAYAFQFNWEKIKELIKELIDTYNQFKKEIARFKEQVTITTQPIGLRYDS
ncbi:MAG: hypothetical protein MUF15_06815 [Acidobacteria bacterium]|jgi:uncharacterized protein YutE (UPF0331/DUF86 family)|nr:hypothetical protein [Acidobacteriota bacterium]